jgi:hypothetical protein
MFHLLGRLRLLATLVLLAAVLPLNPAMAAPANPPRAAIGRYFPETGHMLDPQFIAYYDKYNGSRVFGAPISESYQENSLLVQVFERGRLEFESAGGKVGPSPLGRLLTAGHAPDAPIVAPASDPRGLYDATTGHTVADTFADYWFAAGGARGVGRPITEMGIEGDRPVQYFDFARLSTDASGKVTADLQDNSRVPGSPFQPVAKPADTKGKVFVAATGHIVQGGFYDLYRSLGGAETLGAPLTEEAWEDHVTVQYFEWAKMEWHADYPRGKQIVLAALSQDWLARNPAPDGVMTRRADYQVIGSATTSFRDSIPGRVHNLSLATQRLNGLVVPAGSVLSFNKALGPDGASAGFVIAKIIYNGRTIDGIGGGICQVATTFFRAAFYAGMDIVERHPHTYRVSFYEPPVGFDATVFSDEGVDFRWRNNLDVPVLVQTAVDTRAQTITFTLLATKPAKYKAKLSGPVISNIVKHGPPIYEDDPKLPVGTTKQTEHAKDGMTTTIQRILTDPASGKVVRTETYTSRYVPWNDRYSRGTKGAKPKAAAPKPTTAPATAAPATQAPAAPVTPSVPPQP